MKNLPKIPLGITAASTTALALGTYNTIKANRRAEKAEAETESLKELPPQGGETNNQLSDLAAQSSENTKLLKEIQQKQNELISKVDDSLNKNEPQKLIENFSFDKIFDTINELYTFFISLSIQSQLAFLNSLFSIIYILVLSSTAINLYSQYLIDRFKLEEKYPKLYRLLEFRKTIQRYYRYYYLIIGIYIILLQLFINLYALYNFIYYY